MSLRKSWSNRPLVIVIVIQYSTVAVDVHSVCQPEHPEHIRYLYGQSWEAHSYLSLIPRTGLLYLHLIVYVTVCIQTWALWEYSQPELSEFKLPFWRNRFYCHTGFFQTSTLRNKLIIFIYTNSSIDSLALQPHLQTLETHILTVIWSALEGNS